MHLLTVSCALIAGLLVSAIPSPMQGKLAEKHFLKIQQQVTAAYPSDAITGSIGGKKSADVSQSDSDESATLGNGLTCEQIRIMDEVELITDDSYCSNRS